MYTLDRSHIFIICDVSRSGMRVQVGPAEHEGLEWDGYGRDVASVEGKRGSSEKGHRGIDRTEDGEWMRRPRLRRTSSWVGEMIGSSRTFERATGPFLLNVGAWYVAILHGFLTMPLKLQSKDM